MTFEEYTKAMDELSAELDKASNEELFDKKLEEIIQFQYKHMEKFLEEYKSTIDSEAKKYIYDVFHYAVHKSQTGNAITDIPTKELADIVEEIIWEEIGDYLLDCEVYEEEDHYTLDVMFGGYYVPDWDGWTE